MKPERHVKLFRNGRNQTIWILREFEIEGDEAILRKEGDRLTIKPVRTGSLLESLRALGPLDKLYPDIEEDLPAADLLEI